MEAVYKILSSIVTILLGSTICLSQDKVVYIESEKRDFRFFYKQNKTSEIVKDSVYYSIFRVNDSTFFLEKRLKDSIQYRSKFRSVPDKEDLVVYYKIWKKARM